MVGGEDRESQISPGKSTDFAEGPTNATRDGLEFDESSCELLAWSAVEEYIKEATAQVGRDDGESTDAWCGVEASARRGTTTEQASARNRNLRNDQQRNHRTGCFEDESLDGDLEGGTGGGGGGSIGTKDEGLEECGVQARCLRSILKSKTVAEGRRAKLIAVGGEKVRFDVVPGMGPGEGVGEAARGGLVRVGRKKYGDMNMRGPTVERQGSVAFEPDAEGGDWGNVMNLMNLKEMADAAMEEGATQAEEGWVQPRGVPDHVKNPFKYTCYTLEWGEEDEERQNLAAQEAVTRVRPPGGSQDPPPPITAPITFVAPKKGREASAWSASRRGRGKGHQRITLDGLGDSGACLERLEAEGGRPQSKGVSVWAAQAAEQEEGEGEGEVEAMGGIGVKKGAGRGGRQYRNRQSDSKADSKSRVDT